MSNLIPLSHGVGPATVTTLGGSCQQEPVEVLSRSADRIGLVSRVRMPVGAAVELTLAREVLLGEVVAVEPAENGHFATIRVKYALAAGELADDKGEDATRSSLVNLLEHLRAAEKPASQLSRSDRSRSR